MADTFDVIVIGSGFGGAVTACRLAEKGGRVLVLERGRRWEPKDYPRDVGDAWIWDQDEPHKQNGWIDLRIFHDMAVVQGTGVGGGSLIYANIFVKPHPEVFNQGWPPEITFAELAPHYETAGKMLGVQEIPDSQLTERFKLMREAAEGIGHGDRFRKLPLAVTFDPDWNYQLDDPFSEGHSKTFTNDHGVQQGTCIHLGNCDIGCEVRAKNTLDVNYLAVAERNGAEIRPLHMVTAIEPSDGKYRVTFDRLDGGRRVRGSVTADRVVLGAGSIGSTDILLRCKHLHKTLPGLSPFLGRNWSSNGDFLTPAYHGDRRVSPSQGPTITSAIDFLDGSVDNQQFFIEDGGFPDVLGNFLFERVDGEHKGRRAKILFGALQEILRGRDPLSHLMPWFAQGIDAADGRLYLGRKWYAPWRRVLKLDWDIERSEGVMDAIVDMHKKLAAATGGTPFVPPTWSVLKNLVTPHPLGGCNMGTTSANGVVNHFGEVFGCERLYVADGAIMPEAVGLNPSRTIAALAERIAAHID